MLEIRALGNLMLSFDGEDLDSISLRAQVLLVYLSLEGGKHNRNYLAAMLWPESPGAKALTSFRVLLSELRKVIPDCLEINRTNLGIKPSSDLYLDTLEFEGLLKAGDIKRAYDLYRGDLLSGVYIPGSTEFENWRRWENERIRMLAIDQGEKAILKEFGLGNYEEVEFLARYLIKIEPTNEVANLYYSISQALRGHRAAAIRQIQVYQTRLREFLNLDLPEEIINIQKLIDEGNLDSIIDTLGPKQHLPAIQTTFVGRESEIQAISTMLFNPDCRLISIVGPGGIGKTRLAIEVARETNIEFPDGSFFVPLDTVTSGNDILPAIANALQLMIGTVGSDLDPQTHVYDYLGDRTLVLILDCFEHLTDSGHLLSKLLAAAPKIQMIITSRHKLNLPEEWTYTLEGLPIHESEDIHDDLPDALSLFISRINQILPEKTISESELKEAARICRLVEGMPLGIELAAAWAAVLDFSEIADEITENYGFLEDHHQDSSSKHKSMRAVFQSSWNLLEKTHQEYLLMLSVFRGGFSRQAAQEISKASITDLAVLMDRSLLRKNFKGQFEIHPIVQQFCREIISGQENVWQEIQQKHYLYYSDYLTKRMPKIYSLEPDNTRAEVHDAIANILAAGRYYLEQSISAPEPNIIQDIFSYYLIRGWHEGAIAFHTFADTIESINKQIAGDTDLLLARVNTQEAYYLSNLGLFEEGEQLSQKSLPILQGSNHIRELAMCLNNLGINAIHRGEYDLSLQYLEKAILLGLETNCYSLPSYYLWVGYVYFLVGDYDLGMSSLNDSLECFGKQNNHWGKAFSYSKMGLASDGLGNYQEALNYHHQSLSIFKQTGDHAGQGYDLSRMSLGALLLGDYQAALQYGLEGMEQFKEVGHRWGICVSLCRIGYAKLGLGEIDEAGAMLREAMELSHHNLLDPLCLHALGGIAIQMLLSGNQSEALGLSKYVILHPKTPEIYKELTWKWLDQKKVLKKGTDEDQLTLDLIVQNILKDKPYNSQNY